jgi:hypothetical protein
MGVGAMGCRVQTAVICIWPGALDWRDVREGGNTTGMIAVGRLHGFWVRLPAPHIGIFFWVGTWWGVREGGKMTKYLQSDDWVHLLRRATLKIFSRWEWRWG